MGIRVPGDSLIVNLENTKNRHVERGVGLPLMK